MIKTLEEIFEEKKAEKERLQHKANTLKLEISELCEYNLTHTYELRTLEEIELRKQLRVIEPKIERLTNIINQLGFFINDIKRGTKVYETTSQNEFQKAIAALSA